MEQDEFQQLWHRTQPPASAGLPGPPPARELPQRNVSAELASLRPQKVIALALGIGWVALVGGLLWRGWPWENRFFVVSALLQVLLTQAVIVIYLYQLVLLRRVDAGATVVAAQHRIARLQATTLWSVRLSCLQLPCWTTFYLSPRLLAHAPVGWLLVQSLASLLAVAAAAWLFWNVRYENRHQRWFQRLFNGPEWQPLVRSLHFLEQVEGYRSGAAPEDARSR